MDIVALSTRRVSELIDLAELNAPFVRPRSESDYWLYAELFAQTCPVAVDAGQVVGAVLGFRSQSIPSEVYLQDVMTHPSWRRRGVTRQLINIVRDQAQEWGCQRLWLTSEAANLAAHATWLALGFTNMPGDYRVGGVEIIADFKGPGKDRAVYEVLLRTDAPSAGNKGLQR